MAVNKLYEPFNPISLILGRASLEATLTRFTEELALYTPAIIRDRLRVNLGGVKVNIDGKREDTT